MKAAGSPTGRTSAGSSADSGGPGGPGGWRSSANRPSTVLNRVRRRRHQVSWYRRLVSEDRFRDAATAYFRLTSEQARRLLTPEHSIALGNWLAAHDHPEAALVLYQRHLRDYPLGPLDAEAHLGAGLVQLNALRQPTAAYQHLVEVFDLDPDTETETRARQALTDIAARQKFRVPERRTKP